MLKEGGRKREREDGKTPTLEAKKERAREMERERERETKIVASTEPCSSTVGGVRGVESVRKVSLKLLQSLGLAGSLARSFVRLLARSLALAFSLGLCLMAYLPM